MQGVEKIRYMLKEDTMSEENEYVLGTNSDELERLGIQHRIWADETVRAWKKAGIGYGSKVLDLGCGPGFASYDLAQLVGRNGLVRGLDQSERFLRFVNEQAKKLGLTQLSASLANAEEIHKSLKNEMFDFAYTRWLLCWLRSPEKAVQGVFDVLKPGGKFIVHDYFNWHTMTLAPRDEVITKMVNAAVESFAEQGGDIDIAARLPKILQDCGFKLIHFEVHLRAPRGGGVDGTLHWLLTWWRTYAPKLVDLGKLSSEELDMILRKLDALENDENQFFTTPPVFEFIAEKPR